MDNKRVHRVDLSRGRGRPGRDRGDHSLGAAGRLEQLGVHYTAERVVERGKVITAAGVSSGIDMALTLLARMYDAETAERIQLAIEYDPQPPFDAGSPTKAPAEIVDFLQQVMGPGPALAAPSGAER